MGVTLNLVSWSSAYVDKKQLYEAQEYEGIDKATEKSVRLASKLSSHLEMHGQQTDTKKIIPFQYRAWK